MAGFPLPGANWTYLHTLRLVATTGVDGFALVNGTPTIISWTAPADGNLHRAFLAGTMDITSDETGGEVEIVFTMPDGTVTGIGWFDGSENVGYNFGQFNPPALMVKPGSTVTISQESALTGGAATLWAEIWAS